MASFSELRASAGERWQPEEGGEYTTLIVEVRIGETAKGNPKIGLWHEVVGGEDSGERFWDNIFFSASSTANNMAFAKIEAACPTANETFFNGDPDETEIERKLMGSKMKVRTTYDENDRDKDRPWLRAIYMATEDQADSDTIEVF
jgi:hypothetical protein